MTSTNEKLVGDILALESYMREVLEYTDEEIDDIKHGINPFKNRIVEIKYENPKKLLTKEEKDTLLEVFVKD